MKNVHYIVNPKGQKTGVVLTIRQYEKLLEKLEELSDIVAYDKAKRSSGKSQNFRDFLKEHKRSQA